jgi:hypothetical protein
MTEIRKQMYDEFFSIPLVETKGAGWKELKLNLSITLEDGTTIDNITMWRYRDDMITMINNERCRLPEFISYEFVEKD